MARNYLIGVGGTGCRCMEPAIHFCAAGLGPPNLWAGFVDADQSNGNLARASRLLDVYRRLWHDLRREGAESRLANDSPWFGTNILSQADTAVWSPVPSSANTLRDLFHYEIMDEGEKTLFEALFRVKGEQDLNLEQGFRGRPSIGAAVTLSQAVDNDPFWQEIIEAVKKPTEGERVRIFLVGSIFGGTGASGFPVLARLLRHSLAENEVAQGVEIGGALMLPYFTFPTPASDGRRAVGSDVFLSQARASLKYYHSFLRRDPVFDNLYLIGWPRLIPLETSAPGGTEQVNPPLAPELLAAAAALKFFNDDEIRGPRLFYCGRDTKKGAFDWTQIPEFTAGGDAELKQRFGQLVRFAFAFDRIYGELLSPDGFDDVWNHPWFQRLVIDEDVPIEQNSAQRAVSSMTTYCQSLLRWTATVCYRSHLDDYGIDLFEADAFAANDMGDIGLVKLHEEMDGLHADTFPEIVRGAFGADLAEVFDGLNYSEIAEGTRRLGCFLQLLYDECEITA